MSQMMARQTLASAAAVFMALGLLASNAEAQTRVFVTSTLTTGNMGGLAGADQICADRATAGSLGGTWVAWLSTTTVNAVDRLNPGSGPFVTAVGGTEIATDIAHLTTPGALLTNPPNQDELGTIWLDDGGTEPQRFPFTGTLRDGTYAGPTDCTGWTLANGATVKRGTVTATTDDWTSATSAVNLCFTERPIYCFETAVAIPATTPLGGLVVLILLSLTGLAYFYRRQQFV